jgi:hypothetical protein
MKKIMYDSFKAFQQENPLKEECIWLEGIQTLKSFFKATIFKKWSKYLALKSKFNFQHFTQSKHLKTAPNILLRIQKCFLYWKTLVCMYVCMYYRTWYFPFIPTTYRPCGMAKWSSHPPQEQKISVTIPQRSQVCSKTVLALDFLFLLPKYCR